MVMRADNMRKLEQRIKTDSRSNLETNLDAIYVKNEEKTPR